MVNPDEVMRQIRQYDICKCALNLVFFQQSAKLMVSQTQ